jgi:hypothetical protein
MILFYQKHISPLLGPRCRFIPTCSQYTYEAIEVHGFVKGILLGIRRLLKCHPFNKSPMYDPVPSKTKDNEKNVRRQ